MKKERLPNFESLRVLSMIMVTLLHALGHGGILESYEFGSLGCIFFYFLKMTAIVAVNEFVLITGYFMTDLKFKLSRIVRLIIQVWFYSVVALLIAKFILNIQPNFEDIIRSVFPVTGNAYWFVSEYAVLTALSPLLNKIIHSLDKKQHLSVCAILSIIFCIIPSVFFWSRKTLTSGYSFIWFIVLYFVSSYIKKYGSETSFLNCGKGRYLAAYAVFCVLGLLSYIVIGYITSFLFGEPKYENIMYAYNSIIVFGASICLFLFFRAADIKNKSVSRCVCGLGSVAFGAYLCSENDLIREPLWDYIDLPKLTKNGNRGVITALIGMITWVVIIFIAGCLIEFFRSRLFNIPVFNKLMNKIDSAAEKVAEKINRLYEEKQFF